MSTNNIPYNEKTKLIPLKF